MAKQKQTKPAPIYVIAGKDSFLVSRQLEPIIDSLLEPDEKEMGYLVVEGAKADAAEILDELRTLPFLSSRRVVYVRQADSFVSDNRPVLENYLDSPAKSGVLIMHVETWRKNTKLAKKVDQCGVAIDTGEIKPWELADFALRYAQSEHGKTLTKRSAELLVEFTGDEPGRICSEIDKLAVYAINDKNITEEHISTLTGNNREYDIFKVIDAMATANTSQAVARLRNMFTASPDAAFTVVAALASHFRRMFRVKNLQQQRLSQQQICTKMGMSSWWLNKFLRQANLQKWQFSDLAGIIKALARTDYEAKTGQTDLTAAVEQIIVKACLRMKRR
ncbi:DNA polymerase III subunit delta [Limihaloglobus sulfuriphilus]|uniref:DNA polymerase III subunit delta n=1 Tax=Limihaloglobus sulfuriphilus TaxID=1851148 RepID=A0A1Q2MDA0_9BACT|nr:DNA polymerase III subunit delta [Limihaloglobus sulfuriphilus]AQQ70624.1 DNA polymerase III subunit delta [Limihaloglobus sulfuriphilus]